MQVLASSTACNYAHQTYHGMLVDDVVNEVKAFTLGEPPADDQTLLGMVVS